MDVLHVLTRNFWAGGPISTIFSSVEAEFNFPQLENISDPLEAQKTDVNAKKRGKKSEKRFMAGPGIKPRPPWAIDECSTDLPSRWVTD